MIQKVAELVKHLCHFVSALAAADVYDYIGVAPLGKLMLGHGLSRSESARYGSSAAFCKRSYRINNALTGYKRNITLKTFFNGASGSYGPRLAKRQILDVTVFVL